ncbi:hypothetical protein Dda_7848 [Drechslerella dactyloides]|uniref:Uncharacterized protein n=1 Tax=Drechslerella dactyloides TaxID=74499 RepID=A0AAD6ISS4_DREDA|nr:hypothetical protein Dda_7848 [Drechslerella dactyloides]
MHDDGAEDAAKAAWEGEDDDRTLSACPNFVNEPVRRPPWSGAGSVLDEPRVGHARQPGRADGRYSQDASSSSSRGAVPT